jgi:HNH endonuclease
MAVMPDVAARLWARVDRSGTCWMWVGATLDDGHGVIYLDGYMRQVHRVCYELLFGPIPPGTHVLRTCGTAACLRPDHLVLGDDAAAAQLRAARGRTAAGDRHGFRRHPEIVPRGTRHHAHKLTWRDVHAIRARYHAGRVTTRALADEYGVRQSTIWEVVTGRSWRE